MAAAAQRCRAQLLLAIVGLLALVSRCSAQQPLLLWSNADVLLAPRSDVGDVNGLSSGSRAVYQVASAQQAAGHLVLASLGKQAQARLADLALLAEDVDAAARADLVVVFESTQVDAAALRQAARLPALAPLAQAVDAAGSSLLLPFLQSSTSGSLLDALQPLLAAHGLGVQIVGCAASHRVEQEDQVVPAVRAALAADKGLKVLVVCPPSDSAAAEAEVVAAVAAEVVASGQVQGQVPRRAVFLYATRPSSRLVQQSRRRQLQATNSTNATTYSGFGPYTACGQLCWTQVRWLEGMLALLVLAIATSTGMTCLYLLNTPTRFESLKDASSGAN